MSSGSSSSARSSPSSSGKHFPQQAQQHQLEAGDNFVIPGQNFVRFNPGHQQGVHQSIFNVPPASTTDMNLNARRSSDATVDPQRPSSSANCSNDPPIVPKPGRRFSLAQALSNVNHQPTVSKSLLSKNKNPAKELVKEESFESPERRKDSTIGPSDDASRSKSPVNNDRGRKDSTTSITSTSSKVNASSNANGTQGGGKRRQSRIAFFTHRLGSEAIPDMKSLSVSSSPSSSSSKTKEHHHHFLPNLLGHGQDKKVPIETYRLVVLGGSRVGKTAIVQRFLYDKFPETHSATVEELHRAEYEVKGLGIVGVEILDTSGSFPFPAMQRLAISSGAYYYKICSIMFLYFLSCFCISIPSYQSLDAINLR